MSKFNDNYYKYHYKSMDWYELLGFDCNERNKERRRGEYWSAEEIEKKYQNCLSLLNRSNLSEINLFYEVPLLGWKIGKIENLGELREKIQLAYETLINPEKRKEYDLEVFGIFHYDYPENEIADEKFRLRAINTIENFLQEDEWDEDLGHSYWKNYLTGYWQNCLEKVKTMKYKEEMKFLMSRLYKLRMFILQRTGWGKKDCGYENASELIEQEKLRLQNITKEEWDKELKKNEMSEEDIEWVASEVEKFLKGENKEKPSNTSALTFLKKFNAEKDELRKWMEENNIEEIILEGRNKVLCKKCNNDGSLSFGSDFVPGDKEISEGSRVKIAGVDMVRFFQKNGKNSITSQELGINQPSNSEKSEIKNQNDFAWTPWIIGGGILVSVIILLLVIRKKRKKIVNDR